MRELEELFAMHVKGLGLPTPIREYQALPERLFRWDFAWPEKRVLVEINGGTFQGMGHSTGKGIARDYEKVNLAQLAGWRTFLFDRKMVESGRAVEMVQEALKAQ